MKNTKVGKWFGVGVRQIHLMYLVLQEAKEEWFEKVEYSDEHLIVACHKCNCRLRSDLKFVEVKK